MTDSIDRFAAHVVSASYDDFPDETLTIAKKFILDTIGVCLMGSSGPWVTELIQAHHYPSTKGIARVIGSDAALTAQSAAMCNAYQMHNSEFDCFHEGAVVHPLTCVLAACLAEIDKLTLSKKDTITGRHLIQAVTLGVDVACNIGIASQTGLRFFRPGTCGAFGATAAIGVLRRLTKKEMINAFGIVFAQMCGTMQAHTEGSPLLGMQMGFNARNAIIACDIARQGIPAPRDILEGPFGYFKLFEGKYDFDNILTNLGKNWRINEISHKPFPSGRATHGIIDACLRLREKYHINEKIIDNIKARVPPLVHHLVGRPVKDNMNINYARLCAQFTAAEVLIAGKLNPESFNTNKINNQETINLAKKIIIEVDGNPDPNTLTPLLVEVTYNDGSSKIESICNVIGHPSNPMSRNEWINKFKHNWSLSAIKLDTNNCEKVIDSIEDLENQSSVGAIINMLVP